MPELSAVTGEVASSRTALTYGRKTVNGRVLGTNTVYGEARKHYPQAGGRFFTDADEEEKRRVVFLGNEMAKDIFGKEDPVGKTLNREQLALHGHRSQAAQDADGRLWRSGPEPRRHPMDDVQGAFSSGASG